MESVFAIALGLGLAAASGMRVFVPLLALSVASATGHVVLAPGWTWLSSTTALVAFATATVLEVVAYAVPWLDHALDVVATPAAFIAGMISSASVLVDMPPLLKWSIVIIGGGGLSGLTQGVTVLARIKSGLLTGGLANPMVGIAELAIAIGLSVLAIFVPIAAIVVLTLLLWFAVRHAGRLLLGRPASPSAPGGRAMP